MISKHAPQYFISRPLSLIIFNYQKSMLLLLFFLKRARPDSVDRALGLGQWQRKSRTILTLLAPLQRKQQQLHDKASCHNSSPSNTPNFPHNYCYLTSTTPTAHRQSSCSTGVLDNCYTTVWYYLHTYSKSHNESLWPPIWTGSERDWQNNHIFPVPRKHPLDRNVWYNSS